MKFVSVLLLVALVAFASSAQITNEDLMDDADTFDEQELETLLLNESGFELENSEEDGLVGRGCSTLRCGATCAFRRKLGLCRNGHCKCY